MKLYKYVGRGLYDTVDGDTIRIAKNTVFTRDRNKLDFDGDVYYFKAIVIKDILSKSEEISTKDSKLFPVVKLPASTADVKRLYTYFHKSIFNMDPNVPKTSEVKFAKLTQSLMLYGTAQHKVKIVDGSLTVTPVLSLSERAMVSVEQLCNTLIHEMIHLKFQSIAHKTNDSKYFNVNHGPLFVAEMDRINKLGYNITITVDDVVETELQSEVNVLVLKFAASYVAFWSFKQVDEQGINDLCTRSGLIPDASAFFKTTDPRYITGGVRVSNNGLPKLSYKKWAVLNRSSDLVKDITFKPVDKASREVEAHLSDIADFSWKQVQQSVAKYSEFASVRDNEALVRSVWIKHADRVFKQDKQLKTLYNNLLRDAVDEDKALDYIVDLYRYKYEGRIGAEDYAAKIAKRFDILTMSTKQIIKTLLNLLSK